MDYERLADIVREEIREDYVPNACILAARVTTRALRKLGIQAEAMAAEVEAFSPAYVRLLDRMHQLQRALTPQEVEPFVRDGAWRVSLKFGGVPDGVVDRRNDRGYHAHVVVLADDRRWLVDPTLPQMSRPQKGLVIEPPYAWEIDYADARASGVTLVTENGTFVHYDFLPGRRDFVKAPDWRAPGFRGPLMEKVIDRVVTRMQEEARAQSHR